MTPPDLLALSIGEHRICCWSCGRNYRDKTMGVTVDGDGAVFHCFRCSLAGRERPERPSSERPLPPPRVPSSAPKLEWSATAEAIWRRTVPLRTTLGEAYLKHRGCVLPPLDSALRYLAPEGTYPPTLCALVTDVVTGRPLTLHFTKLAANGRGKAGTDLDKTLLRGHRKAGGVIRLWPNEAVTRGLAIAEGIETALAAAHAYAPAWACVDASNLAAFPVLSGIESLVVVADHDDVGVRAADACGSRWEDAGREVLVVVPEAPGTDMADVVCT